MRPPTFDELTKAACVAVACWILAGLALITAVHVDDLYRVSHVSGTWMALAQYLGDGTLYPPLYDGERYGGTRFMPLQILLHGGLAELTGDYLVSGKLLAFAIGAGLLGTLFTVLRTRFGVPLWLALALLAALVPTQTGLTAMTSIRGDALPVALQLGAILTLSRWSTRRGAVAAGLLCAAALMSKISALWAPVAIVIWLFARDRQRLPSFLVAFVASTMAAFGSLELATDGRFSDNVLGLATSALEDPSAVGKAVFTKPLAFLDSDASAISILLPLALADVVLAVRARKLVIEHIAFAASVLVTLGLMADMGVVSNHLLDLEVLTLLLVGHLWAVHGRPAETGSFVAVLVPIAILWAAIGSYVIDMHPDVKAAMQLAGGGSPTYSAEPLAGVVATNSRVLSEDPTVVVTRGRHPTVLDPFMLLRIVRRHPPWGADLVRRLDRHEFDRVVLRTDHVGPNGEIDVAHPRWKREHFGRLIIAAIARNYRLESLTVEYAVYAPAGA